MAAVSTAELIKAVDRYLFMMICLRYTKVGVYARGSLFLEALSSEATGGLVPLRCDPRLDWGRLHTYGGTTGPPQAPH